MICEILLAVYLVVGFVCATRIVTRAVGRYSTDHGHPIFWVGMAVVWWVTFFFWPWAMEATLDDL